MRQRHGGGCHGRSSNGTARLRTQRLDTTGIRYIECHNSGALYSSRLCFVTERATLRDVRDWFAVLSTGFDALTPGTFLLSLFFIVKHESWEGKVGAPQNNVPISKACSSIDISFRIGQTPPQYNSAIAHWFNSIQQPGPTHIYSSNRTMFVAVSFNEFSIKLSSIGPKVAGWFLYRSIWLHLVPQ